VKEIAATWRVPTIAPHSPTGYASTWIGVQDRAGDFVQLGTVENNYGPFSSGPTDWYEAFWSDTDLQFLPQSLFLVRPGDQVSSEMIQEPAGWVLKFRDVTDGRSMTRYTTYGGTASLDRAEWLQEDPVPKIQSDIDGPYPIMSTVSFGHLAVNRQSPQLPYVKAQTLSSPNGVFLVPSQVENDSFSLDPPDGIEAQYLTDVSQFNQAINKFDAEYRPGGPEESLRTDGAALIRAISVFNSQLRSQEWPAAAQGDVRRLGAHNSTVVADLNAWMAAATSSRTVLFERFVTDAGNDHDFADRIRADIGLPPAAT
jgi:hypothetical protein